MQDDKPTHAIAKQQVHDMAKFAEENPNPVLRVGVAGGILFANAAARELSGLLENNGSCLANQVGVEVAAAHAARHSREIEFSSGQRLFSFFVTPVPGETYLYGREITEERRAQQQSRNVEKFKNENPNPVLRVGVTGEVLFANAAARELVGLLADNDVTQELGTAVATAFAARQNQEVELALSDRLFAFALIPVPGEAYVNLYGREVTEERRSQQKMRDMAKFPEENPNPVLRADGEGKVFFANTAAHALAGLFENDGSRLIKQLRTAVIDAYTARQTWHVEFTSSDRLFNFSVIPVPGEAYVNVYGREITEERHAQKHLASMQAELARAARLTSMGEMAASIAHEINQPLASVVNNASAAMRWLNREPPNIEEVKAALSRIVGDGLRGSDVIASVRAMVKKGDGRRVQVDPNELINEVMRLTEGQFQKYDVSVRVDLANDAPKVWGDRVQLQQVILNLLMNAADAVTYIADRERLVRLRSEKHDGHDLLIAVEDSGTGIGPDDKKRIFDAFYTTKSEGMGMGLSICRSIVESHGGRITVESATPYGSAFHIILPGERLSGD